MPAAAPISQFQVLDRDAAETFLEFLDPNADQFTFQTFTDSEEKKKTYAKNLGQITDPLAKVLHGTLEQHWTTLVDLSRQGAGVFVTVNRTTLRGRRNVQSIIAIRAYFPDCDGVPVDEMRASLTALGLRPHIIVQTSPGKFHIYFCVNDALLSSFKETQKKLAALFGSDESVCDLPRVTRLPGFPHQKDGSKGEIVALVHTFDGDNYPDTVFQEALNKALFARDRMPSYLKADRKDTTSSDHLAVPPPPRWSEYEDAKLRSALDYVDAVGKRIWDPNAKREVWSKTVAAAIASLGWGIKGEEIFIYWSAQTTIEDFFPGDEACRKEVRSYKKGRSAGCLTEATIYKAVRDAGWREPDAISGQAKSTNTDGQTTATNPNVSPGHNLPVIEVIGGGLSNEATAGEGAIIRAGHPIFSRGTMLVRPVIQEVDATRGRRTKVAQLLPVSQPYMIDLLCRSAHWKRYDRRLKMKVSINPPEDTARVILHRSGQWKFDEIVGVITTPTLRPDGSLLVQRGYDAITRMMLMEPPGMPAISEHPTREEAIAAFELLDGLLNEFPFADDASRSVALSSLITPVVRAAFQVAPMHAVCAPSAGTGKSYLLDTAAAIAMGQPCPVMAAGRTEEETEKRLGAALLAGQPIINIDNVNGDLGGDALCQIIERPVVEIRILGKSKLVRIESRTTLFATGNNLRLVGDMTRRVLRCILDANQERPELRQFKRDPVAEVLAGRGRYVAAVLTLVRAYIAAGRPCVASRLASFEGWSDTVRSPLIWLGRADPLETMEGARKDDPMLQAVEAVFAGLKQAIGIGQKTSVAEIIQLADEMPSASLFNSSATAQFKYPGLKEALQNVAGDRAGIIDRRELGKWLSRHKGRIARGVRLEGEADGHGHAARWWLIECG
jgi:putative DNA primase/helicase